MADAFTPRTTVDSSQFQGIINLYTTEREVPEEMPLPAHGDAVTVAWGDFTGHIIIDRGSRPLVNGRKRMWVVHIPLPVSFAVQDAYNFAKTGADAMSRFYVMKRSDYLAGGYAATIPVAGTADTAFAPFKFATETVSKIGSDPNSYLVAVERIYLLSPKIERDYDDELDADFTRTTEVVPRNSVVASSAAGTTVLSIPGSEHHDLKITTTLDGDYSTARQLESLPSDTMYSFPPLLRGISIVAAWAWANSDEAAPAYDESYYIRYDLVKPTGGPYETRILRFLTTDPDTLRASYPIQKIVTVNESIGIARAWANASDRGNSAFAEARQIDIPESIHGDLEIENGDTISIGQSTNTLPATPNFAAFAAMSSMVIGYVPRKTRYGLYLIEVTELNCTGVYNGVTIPLGGTAPDGTTGDTGANDPPPAASRPLLPTAIVASDNTTISGVTSPYSEVVARNGYTPVGRVMSDADGAYTLTLDPVYTDPVDLVVTARRGGVSSLTAPVTTYDLAPLAPAATLSGDMTTLTGTTDPGATVAILVNAVAQVETYTIPTTQKQVERLTVVGTITDPGGAGNARLTITWPGFNGGSDYLLDFAVADGDTEEIVATKGAAVVMADGTAAAFFTVTSDGPHIYFEANTAAANETGANIAIDNSTCTGLTPVATSTTTVAGIATATITSAGTANAIITSGIADWSPATVTFHVESGDDMDDVADKAAAAIALALPNNDYIPASPANTLTLTAREEAPNDTALSITITNGTCEGIIEGDTSANTTPGVGAVTVVANSSGSFAYAFSPALIAGDEISITATDDGGTSPATVIEASLTPPELFTAAFTDPTLIEGTATIGADVIAYVDDVEVGHDIADGSGDFAITLTPGLIRGETVRVIAVTMAGLDRTNIRSAAIFLTADVIDLEIPTFTETSAGYVGTLPAGATDIVIYPESDPGDEESATVHPNGNFLFTLPDELGENGERWAVVARYPEGDSDPVWFYAPTVDLGPLTFQLEFSSTRPGGAGTPLDIDFFHYVWIAETRPGMVLTLSFPGSAEDDVTINVDDFLDFTIPSYADEDWPFAVHPEQPRFGAYIPVYDTDDIIPGVPGPIPVPLVVATLAVPDGRVYTATFDRGLFTNSAWDGEAWALNYSLPVDEDATSEWKTTYP